MAKVKSGGASKPDAAKPAANEVLTCLVLREGLEHDGLIYDQGEEVQLTAAQAAPLVALGVVRAPAPEIDAAQE